MRDFEVAGWSVRPDLNRLEKDGAEVHLEPRLMDLLVYLSGRPGEVVATDQLIRDVWPEPFVSDGALLTAISSLRKALGDDPRRPSLIETIPKRGYRFIGRTSARRAAIAVLPLDDLSAGSEEGFFADGMTEALIAELGRVPSLRVISRQSVMAYRGSEQPVSVIGRELDAGLIVQGSVLRSGEQVRITVQLIEASDDRHLWAESYRRGLGDVLGLQAEIAREIARAISHRLKPVEEMPARAVHPDALVAYLRGRFHWWKFSPPHFDRALEYFEQAVALDPDLARAHAGVADVWGARGYWGLMTHAQVREQVRQGATRAMEIDPSDAESQLALAAYCFHSAREFSRAEELFLRAIELNPNLAHARVLYALFLSSTNRAEEAIEQADLAIRLDPLSPGPLFVRAMWLGSQGRYGEAERAIDHLLGLAPEHVPGALARADLAWLQQRPDRLELERRAWLLDPEVSAALSADAAEGGRQALLAAADTLVRRNERGYVQRNVIARLFVHAGDPESALDWLERAVDEDDLMQFDHLRLSPAWTPLRRHLRFRSLISRLGLPDGAG